MPSKDVCVCASLERQQPLYTRLRIRTCLQIVDTRTQFLTEEDGRYTFLTQMEVHENDLKQREIEYTCHVEIPGTSYKTNITTTYEVGRMPPQRGDPEAYDGMDKGAFDGKAKSRHQKAVLDEKDKGYNVLSKIREDLERIGFRLYKSDKWLDAAVGIVFSHTPERVSADAQPPPTAARPTTAIALRYSIELINRPSSAGARASAVSAARPPADAYTPPGL
ncbi:hypothetical protein EVAR_69148_1 [Eumeta japonica]|uniref:Uncharacterized protein n=1 Tax=Eumeta variegata TaxID=151549 RepID=A0A4C1SPZ7_EUMVA|nr:hypothetical protein EVAR_69148_1 [Eumeta japonica]